MIDESSQYVQNVQGRSKMRYLIGLIVRWKQHFKYAKAVKIARKRGATIGEGVIMPISLARHANTNLTIGDHSSIESSSHLDLRSPVRIGSNVIIGRGAKILTTSHNIDSVEWEAKHYGITIDDYVWIATDALILPSCRKIGYGAVIGGGSSVVRDVEEMAVMSGNPARELRKRKVVHANLIVESLMGGITRFTRKHAKRGKLMRNKRLSKISVEESKKIQFDILCDLDAFCRKNDIKYSLTYGTLLGSIRHKGFIPWDDDIDVMMTRSNYNKFISLYSASNYKLKNYCCDKTCHHAFTQIYDTRTLYKCSKCEMGVWIDVFPVDGLPKQELLSSFLKEFHYYQSAITRKRKIKYDIRSLVGVCNCAKSIVAKLLYPRSRKSYLQKFDNLCNSHSVENSSLAGSISLYSLYGKKEIMPSSTFQNYTTAEFEGKTFMIITDYDTFLRSIYGDYMQFPPIEKRIGHHHINAYWR